MAKFNWSRSRKRHSYGDGQELPIPRPRYQTRQSRTLKDLNARIESGKEWIATIPQTDPRWPKWQARLASLIHQRNQILKIASAKSPGANPAPPK